MTTSLAISIITKRLRTALNDKTLTDWNLVLNYTEEELYFMVGKQRIDFPPDGTAEILGDFLKSRYSNYEEENNCKITFVTGIIKKDTKPVLKCYYIDNETEEKLFDEQEL